MGNVNHPHVQEAVKLGAQHMGSFTQHPLYNSSDTPEHTHYYLAANPGPTMRQFASTAKATAGHSVIKQYSSPTGHAICSVKTPEGEKHNHVFIGQSHAADMGSLVKLEGTAANLKHKMAEG
jgi:hypothetical protein